MLKSGFHSGFGRLPATLNKTPKLYLGWSLAFCLLGRLPSCRDNTLVLLEMPDLTPNTGFERELPARINPLPGQGRRNGMGQNPNFHPQLLLHTPQE